MPSSKSGEHSKVKHKKVVFKTCSLHTCLPKVSKSNAPNFYTVDAKNQCCAPRRLLVMMHDVGKVSVQTRRSLSLRESLHVHYTGRNDWSNKGVETQFVSQAVSHRPYFRHQMLVSVVRSVAIATAHFCTGYSRNRNRCSHHFVRPVTEQMPANISYLIPK